MIYAQIHSYVDSNGINQQCISSRVDQPDSTWVQYNVPDASWLTITNGAIVVLTSPAINNQQLRMQANLALSKTDLICLRCLKAGIAYPAAWQAYTIALRNISNGTDTTSTSLPIQPAYPAGT